MRTAKSQEIYIPHKNNFKAAKQAINSSNFKLDFKSIPALLAVKHVGAEAQWQRAVQYSSTSLSQWGLRN